MMTDATWPAEEDALTGDLPPAQPTQVRVWVWTGAAVAPLTYTWTDDDRRLRRFLTDQGFSLEFRAGTEHYPLATVYSHPPEASKASLPYHTWPNHMSPIRALIVALLARYMTALPKPAFTRALARPLTQSPATRQLGA